MRVDRKGMGYNGNNSVVKYDVWKYTQFMLAYYYAIIKCLQEQWPHQHILCVATTESLVVCFVVYGLILPIYNGRDTVVPRPRNVNLPKGFGQWPSQRTPHS